MSNYQIEMDASIYLVGPQLVLTEQGYLSLEELFVLFTENKAPRLAATDVQGQFSFKPLLDIRRRYNEQPWVVVKTDVFGLRALPQSRVWTYDDKGSSCHTLGELFGTSCSFMGIFPMLGGYCPGYTVGAGCWYNELPENELLYEIDAESGVVFTRTMTQEAGVWSGQLIR